VPPAHARRVQGELALAGERLQLGLGQLSSVTSWVMPEKRTGRPSAS
jgi:hypothetical protein